MNRPEVSFPVRNILPKVTVITVVLNAVDVLDRTVRSVIAQDYPDLEYIVVDGRSTDGTLEMLKGFGDAIDTLVSERDGGIYEAMNKGVSLASGDWVVFMNAGDLFVENDAVKRAFSACHWQECDVIYGDGIVNYKGYRIFQRAPQRVTLTDGNGFSHQSTFVRVALQKQYGFDVSERIAADYDLFLRLLKANKVFRHVDVVVSEFFTGGFSDLPLLETIRLRHRVYKKHFPRSDIVLYFRLAMRWSTTTARTMVPEKLWEALKRRRDRGKLLSAGSPKQLSRQNSPALSKALRK